MKHPIGTHYEAVKVCERLADGRINAFYPGSKSHGCERDARKEARDLAREFPDSEFAVMRTTRVECAAFGNRAAVHVYQGEFPYSDVAGGRDQYGKKLTVR